MNRWHKECAGSGVAAAACNYHPFHPHMMLCKRVGCHLLFFALSHCILMKHSLMLDMHGANSRFD